MEDLRSTDSATTPSNHPSNKRPQPDAMVKPVDNRLPMQKIGCSNPGPVKSGVNVGKFFILNLYHICVGRMRYVEVKSFTCF